MDCRSDHEDSENILNQDHQRKRVLEEELWAEQSPPAKKRTTQNEGEECEISVDFIMNKKNVEENAASTHLSSLSGHGEGIIKSHSSSHEISTPLNVSTDSQESLEECVQSTENFSSCEVSLSYNETECESLESSMVFMGNSLDDLSTSALDDEKDKVEPEAYDGTMSQMGAKEKKKKRKRKRKTSKSDVENGDSKQLPNVRPNYFVGVQVSDSEIHKNIIKVQEGLIAFEPAFGRALVDVATSHITLLIARIDDENALSLATSALEEYAKSLEDMEPLQLTFSGLDNFSNSVLYARVVEDEHNKRLIEVSKRLREVFSEKGVCMPNTKPLNPHLTIAKMSKAPRGKGKQCPRKIDFHSYDNYRELHFGSQPIESLQLLSMNDQKDEKRYYHCCKEVTLGKSVVMINNDHSQCCFPRRPVISNLHRSYSTKASKEPLNLVGTSVGFVTALAASLMIVYVVGKVSGKI